MKQKCGQIRVDSGFEPVNSFNMRKSTLGIKVGQTLLQTLGWIRIKDGGPWNYVAHQQVEGIIGIWSGELIQLQLFYIQIFLLFLIMIAHRVLYIILYYTSYIMCF